MAASCASIFETDLTGFLREGALGSAETGIFTMAALRGINIVNRANGVPKMSSRTKVLVLVLENVPN
jgi:hypothetical protein